MRTISSPTQQYAVVPQYSLLPEVERLLANKGWCTQGWLNHSLLWQMKALLIGTTAVPPNVQGYF